MAAQGIDFANDGELRCGSVPTGSGAHVTTVLISESTTFDDGLRHILAETVFRIAKVVSGKSLGLVSGLAVEPGLFLIEAERHTTRMTDIAGWAKERFPAARLVALAGDFDPAQVQAWHCAGVQGFCLTAGDGDLLVTSLELVMLGESVLPSTVARSMLGGLISGRGLRIANGEAAAQLSSDPRVRRLTARETEILSYLMQGQSNKIIARQLDVTEATIKVHVKTILRKIGATNRTQAAIWATDHLPARLGAYAVTGGGRL